ncbi:hypothetical protein PsYK624_143050 [Phanerochaete sordida]|uniref:Uncharacterized protein n=1 Tax=Phanerochaete sordida TaxID=48140 RepID=A0A9P3LK35_9APHY|nr:hypothetical protein PsYK624_143050 [Phanerochaete sordida]
MTPSCTANTADAPQILENPAATWPWMYPGKCQPNSNRYLYKSLHSPDSRPRRPTANIDARAFSALDRLYTSLSTGVPLLFDGRPSGSPASAPRAQCCLTESILRTGYSLASTT